MYATQATLQSCDASLHNSTNIGLVKQ